MSEDGKSSSSCCKSRGAGYLCFYECVGYMSIRRVDRLAAALHSNDVQRTRWLCAVWLRSVLQKIENYFCVYSIVRVPVPVSPSQPPMRM